MRKIKVLRNNLRGYIINLARVPSESRLYNKKNCVVEILKIKNKNKIYKKTDRKILATRQRFLQEKEKIINFKYTYLICIRNLFNVCKKKP